MKIHRNAKTTPTMRALLVQRVREQRWSYSQAAAAAGISVRTTQKWLRRYRLGGPPALEDASSRPHRSPHATPAAAVTRISDAASSGPADLDHCPRRRASGVDRVGHLASTRHRAPPSSPATGLPV